MCGVIRRGRPASRHASGQAAATPGRLEISHPGIGRSQPLWRPEGSARAAVEVDLCRPTGRLAGPRDEHTHASAAQASPPASMAPVTRETDRNGGQRDLVLATPRLILTTWLPVDVDALFEVHSEPETMKFVRHGRPESRVETEELVSHYIAEQAAQGWTKWRLADVAGELVGRAGFGGDASHRGLSFAIRRSHWGLGLATEIAEALVAWHVSHAAAVPLRAIVAVGNEASGRVLQKVGFREVGTQEYAGTICRSFAYPTTT